MKEATTFQSQVIVARQKITSSVTRFCFQEKRYAQFISENSRSEILIIDLTFFK